MIFDLSKAINERFDKKTLTLHIPKIFEFLQGNDVDFEMTASSTLQNLELPYLDNIVVESHGIVLQTDQLKRNDLEPLVYTNSEKHSKLAIELLKD